MDVFRGPARSIYLAAGPDAPREARSFLRDALGDRPADEVELASRLTTEIVSMAVRHVMNPSGKRIRVTAARDQGGLRVTIRDRGPGLALGMASDRRDDVSSRTLVDTASSRWGMEEAITGTYLWIELGTPAT
jgi:anti-sigma regulatory factor (Ser/Thr protein kinase)